MKILGFKLKIGLGWFRKLIGSNRKSKFEFVHKKPTKCLYFEFKFMRATHSKDTKAIAAHNSKARICWPHLFSRVFFAHANSRFYYSPCSLFQQIKKASQLITLLFEAINLTVYFFLLCSASSTIFFFPDSIFVYEFHIYVSLCSIFICTKKIFSFYFIAFDDAVS